MKQYLQTFLSDVKSTRKNKEDFLFEVKFLGDNQLFGLTVDELAPEYVVFRPFMKKDVRDDQKGRFDHPMVAEYSRIMYFRYLGEQK